MGKTRLVTFQGYNAADAETKVAIEARKKRRLSIQALGNGCHFHGENGGHDCVEGLWAMWVKVPVGNVDCR